ncbi:MAG TPA: acetolactate synthase [Thermoleophilaceae bacterium]|jgi:acetolactate synthase-1/2/3 large subunit
MSVETQAASEQAALHGGRLVAKRLRAAGVSKLFTLSGGHLFSIFDGCREEGIDLVDVRHEQSAAFAAEGWAKATREPGVAALTAGPGVTNGMSALASAQMNSSPIVVLGGRAPAMRWGMGSLQEIDHVPFVAPVTKLARTAEPTAAISDMVDEALRAATEPPTGPTFLDFPLDHVFMEGPISGAGPVELHDPLAAPAAEGVEAAAELLRRAERPVVMAGTGLYWARGEHALLRLCEELGVPVFLNGLARGCVPADNPLFFSRARGAALKGADVALVVGVPMDFRLGFGGSFGDETQIVVVGSSPAPRPQPRPVAAELYGGVAATLDALRSAGAGGPDRTAWVTQLQGVEDEKRAAEQAELTDERAPLHPMRVYGELNQVLDRGTIVIGDGGDFVSYAGRMIETYEPGCWMDPGPYGCLGSGPGYAIAAKVARPDRPVCLLLGDGAFGFSGLEFDTMVRHGLPVVGVMGNNGIWGLEHHPMKFLYGYSVAAHLQPELRYDRVVEELGGHGELVQRPEELRPALERAFASGKPALVNVLTDPEVAYPRKANLA